MSSDERPRFTIRKRALNKLLRDFAPDEPASSQLEQLIRDLKRALRMGLPLSLQAKRAERRERLHHLRELEKALWTAARLLRRRVGPTRRAVGDILGAELARLLADQAFADAGFPVDAASGRELSFIRARSREPELAIVEEMRGRRAILAPQSAAVLAGFLARCHALIAAQLEIERGDEGGRPSHPEREYILARIAMVFEDVFGFAPTSSETGKYVSLCADVLELFDLETLGVASAAKRFLAKMKGAPPARPKPKK